MFCSGGVAHAARSVVLASAHLFVVVVGVALLACQCAFVVLACCA